MFPSLPTPERDARMWFGRTSRPSLPATLGRRLFGRTANWADGTAKRPTYAGTARPIGLPSVGGRRGMPCGEPQPMVVFQQAPTFSAFAEIVNRLACGGHERRQRASWRTQPSPALFPSPVCDLRGVKFCKIAVVNFDTHSTTRAVVPVSRSRLSSGQLHGVLRLDHSCPHRLVASAEPSTGTHAVAAGRSSSPAGSRAEGHGPCLPTLSRPNRVIIIAHRLLTSHTFAAC